MIKMIVSALACAMAWAANASINYNIRGSEYVADTIFMPWWDRAPVAHSY